VIKGPRPLRVKNQKWGGCPTEGVPDGECGRGARRGGTRVKQRARCARRRGGPTGNVDGRPSGGQVPDGGRTGARRASVGGLTDGGRVSVGGPTAALPGGRSYIKRRVPYFWHSPPAPSPTCANCGCAGCMSESSGIPKGISCDFQI
jgi:hypothetical protein